MRDLERTRDAAEAKALEACQEKEVDEVLDAYNKIFSELDKITTALKSALARADDNLQGLVSACERVLEKSASNLLQKDEHRITASESDQKL